MHTCYSDILDRIGAAPSWFDEQGVPRYVPFAPGLIANIYASEAALVEIECGGCERRFLVALDESFTEHRFSLSDAIRLNRVSYGDPPNVWCCGAGPSMTSNAIAIHEYWSRDFDVGFEWLRDRRWEGSVGPDALEPSDTAAEIIAALDAGAKAIRVVCTSGRNRSHLAGRIATTLFGGIRVLVTFPESYRVVAGMMLEAWLTKEEMRRFFEERALTFAAFDHLDRIEPGRYDRAVILAPPVRIHLNPSREATAAMIVTVCGSAPRIEFVKEATAALIDLPELVIDAGTPARPAQSGVGS